MYIKNVSLIAAWYYIFVFVLAVAVPGYYEIFIITFIYRYIYILYIDI